MNEMKINGEVPVFGLDIGTRSVVGTVGYKQGEKFVVVAQEIREHQTRAMLDGQIHDINRVAETIKDIKNSLQNTTGIKLSHVCIAAAGRVLKTMNVHVELDWDKERVVTSNDIKTLISVGIEKAFNDFQKDNNTDTHFYCVGHSVIKYYLNGMWMGNLEHHKAKNIGADMIATFLPDDVVDGLYRAVELAGLKVANMTLEPIAAIRIAIPEKFRLLNIAMIDVGAGTSDISITNDGSVIAFGMLPHAGDCLTEMLAKTCLIDFVTAEKIKMAASTQKEIVYEDIMGLEQTITAEEVLKICQPEIERVAKLTANTIKELNGGKSPSAVFIVGGGGKITGYARMIADELDIDIKRVALRGEEIMREIDFPAECIKDSTVITPIGICLSYYEQSNNFIHITFNGNRIKLYDNNKLSVMDAAIQASFSKDKLFPRKGQELHYTVNGMNRVSKGEYGESSHVYVNGQEVDLTYSIKANDNIVIEESTVGKMAQVQISDLVDMNGKIDIMIDGKIMQLGKPVKVNGVHESSDYIIKNDDEISVYSYYTVEQLIDYLELDKSENVLFVNGHKAIGDTPIYSHDVVEVRTHDSIEQEKKAKKQAFYDAVKSHKDMENSKKEKNVASEETKSDIEAVNVFKNMIEHESKEEHTLEKDIKTDENIVDVDSNCDNEKMSEDLLVIVNKKPVFLKGKDKYMFVDIFDYIDFDTSKMKGSGIATLVNGENAQYTQQLHSGDKIEVYWR